MVCEFYDLHCRDVGAFDVATQTSACVLAECVVCSDKEAFVDAKFEAIVDDWEYGTPLQQMSADEPEVEEPSAKQAEQQAEELAVDQVTVEDRENDVLVQQKSAEEP